MSQSILTILPQRNHHGSAKEGIWGGDSWMSRLYTPSQILCREKVYTLERWNYNLNYGSLVTSGLENWWGNRNRRSENGLRLYYSKFIVNFEKILKPSSNLVFHSLNDFQHHGCWWHQTELAAQHIGTRKRGWNVKDKEHVFCLPHCICELDFLGGSCLCCNTTQLMAVQLITGTDPEAV